MYTTEQAEKELSKWKVSEQESAEIRESIKKLPGNVAAFGFALIGEPPGPVVNPRSAEAIKLDTLALEMDEPALQSVFKILFPNFADDVLTAWKLVGLSLIHI